MRQRVGAMLSVSNAFFHGARNEETDSSESTQNLIWQFQGRKGIPNDTSSGSRVEFLFKTPRNQNVIQQVELLGGSYVQMKTIVTAPLSHQQSLDKVAHVQRSAEWDCLRHLPATKHKVGDLRLDGYRNPTFSHCKLQQFSRIEMTCADMAGLTHIGQTFAFISPSNWFVIPSLFNAKARCRTVSVFPQPVLPQ